MRTQDIIIGEYYRLANSPHYGYIKPIKILKAKDRNNPKNYDIVKCEHSVYKNDNYGFIRCFRPRDIIKNIL